MFTVPIAYACEECPTDHEIGLQETIDRSELIIVGYRSDSNTEEYPQTIEITAKQILKGDLNENPITVESYTSDCEYGIVIFDDADYVIFLRDDGTVYSPVKEACAVTKLPYQDELVRINQEESLSLESFMATYLGEDAKVEVAPPPGLIQGKWITEESTWPLVGVFLVVLVGAVCLIKKYAKH